MGCVVYNRQETEFGIVYDETVYYGLGRCYPSSDLEVIGNIHDNPELLERGAKNE